MEPFFRSPANHLILQKRAGDKQKAFFLDEPISLMVLGLVNKSLCFNLIYVIIKRTFIHLMRIDNRLITRTRFLEKDVLQVFFEDFLLFPDSFPKVDF
jgi:hypothetical protein